MKKILDGEVVHRKTTVDVEGKLVVKHHVTKHPEAGLFVMDWTFDFSKCSESQILEFASRDAVIGKRNKWKALPSNKLETYPSVFDMSLVAIKLTDLERATGSCAVLTTEEKKAMIANLQEQVEGK